MVAKPRISQPQTWWLENFGGGLDLREGTFTLDQNRFVEFNNGYVTKGRKIKRRSPCILVAGTFGTNTLGLIQVNAQLYTFVPRGGSSIGTPTGVTVLAYDPPPGTTATAILDIADLNNTPAAYLKHTIGGVDRAFLHVFDNAPDQPTWVTDPDVPWFHQLGSITRVALGVAMTKLWAGTPTADVGHSGAALPRVWNTKTLADLQSSGYEYHYYAAAAGAQSFPVPFKYEDLVDLTKVPFFVVEQFIGTDGDFAKTANWGTVAAPGVPLPQVDGAPGVDQCSVQSTPNLAAVTSYANWTQVNVRPSGTGTWYRLRVLVPGEQPNPVPNFVASGCVIGYSNALADINTISPAIANLLGDGAKTVFPLDIGSFFYDPSTTAWLVTVAGVVKTITSDFTVTAGAKGGAIITFTSAPAKNAAIVITHLTGDTAGLIVHVPQGTIQTRFGVKAWGGGVIMLTNNTTAYLGIALDDSGNPTGLVSLSPNGRDRSVTCILGYYSTFSGRFQEILNLQLIDRDPAWDQTAIFAAQDFAGADDAGIIATSQHESSGGPVMMIQGAKNRLLVSYANGSELWLVDTIPQNDRLIDVGPIGSGTQQTPHATIFRELAVMPGANGFRGVDIQRQLADDMVDLNVGDPIAALGSPPFTAGEHWPLQGEYIAAVTIAGQLTFMVYDYSKESKIAAWGMWTVAGVTSVDYRSLVAINDRLYFRSGSQLYYFDASATVYKDSNDPVALTLAGDGVTKTFTVALGWPFSIFIGGVLKTYLTDYTITVTSAVSTTITFTVAPANLASIQLYVPYETAIMWHYNHMKHPGVSKYFIALDLIMDGTARCNFRTAPWNASYEELGPIWSGPTIGRPRPMLAMEASAVGPVIRSTDASGFNLEAIGLMFRLNNRGIQ